MLASFNVLHKPDKLPVNCLCRAKSSFGGEAVQESDGWRYADDSARLTEKRIHRSHVFPTVSQELTSQSRGMVGNG